MTMITLQYLDYVGVFVFAVSGALVAKNKDMDIFGVVVLALIPAIGGGTLRDLILDVPVFWLSDPLYLYIALSAAVAAFTSFSLIERINKPLLLFDAIGLSVFCVIGTAKALVVSQDYTVAVFMGVITAVAGGIIRDVVANEIPLILQREIYATAAIVGSIAYLVAIAYGVQFAPWIAILVALTVRIVSYSFSLGLPRFPRTS